MEGTGNTPMSTAVVEEVAEREGVHPAELENPLYDVIDPDALDTVFQAAPQDMSVEFMYLRYRIAVHGDGHIDVAVRGSDGWEGD